MKLNQLATLTVAILSAVLYSCGDDDNETPQNPNLIDTSGGTVTSINNDLTITIPAGALSVPTEITIIETTAHPAGNLGVVYDLGPDGTKFNSPVSLTFEYDPSNIPVDRDENDLVVAFAESGGWVPLSNNVVDNGNNTVTATTDHFTPFTVFLIEIEEEIVPPSNLTYEPNEYDIIPDQNLTTQTPSIQGDAPFTYTISAYDPEVAIENFTINAETGVVSFTGSSVFSTGAEQVILDVSVKNSGGSITVEDALTFNLIYPPVSLEYNPDKTVFFPGEMYNSGVPTIQGTAPFTFTLGELPQGLLGSELDINSATGQITGNLGSDVAIGIYSLSVSVSNEAGSVTEEAAITIEIQEDIPELPENISYDVTSEFFVYTGSPSSVQIDIIEGSDEAFTYSLEAFPSISESLSIDEAGNILISDGFLLANGAGYYTLSVSISNGEETRDYDDVVIIRAFNPQGYILEYNPRFSQVSAFNPEILTASTNALFEPPNAPTFSIEKVQDQLGNDRTDELVQQSILTIASDGDLTFSDQNLSVISDNFYSFYVDVRVSGASGNVVYRAVAVFGPE